MSQITTDDMGLLFRLLYEESDAQLLCARMISATSVWY